MHAVISDMVIPIKLAIYLYRELYIVVHHAVSALAIASYIATCICKTVNKF